MGIKKGRRMKRYSGTIRTEGNDFNKDETIPFQKYQSQNVRSTFHSFRFFFLILSFRLFSLVPFIFLRPFYRSCFLRPTLRTSAKRTTVDYSQTVKR